MTDYATHPAVLSVLLSPILQKHCVFHLTIFILTYFLVLNEIAFIENYCFFLFSCIWNSVIIINIPLAPCTGEVASVGLVACLANSSCVPHYHTRLWETTFQTLVSTYLPYVYRLDWQPILRSSMDDNYYWWASLWEW